MITILRLNHRPFRDKRITTHCALTSRALGADEMIYTGTKDEAMEKSVAGVAAQWGGTFKATHAQDHRHVIKAFKCPKIHLTMYGERIQDKISEIRKLTDMLVIVGGEKVPPEVYHEADYNIAIGNQPHSEVAALAIFLHEYHEGKELEADFNGKLRVIPAARGKNVENKIEKRKTRENYI